MKIIEFLGYFVASILVLGIMALIIICAEKILEHITDYMNYRNEQIKKEKEREKLDFVFPVGATESEINCMYEFKNAYPDTPNEEAWLLTKKYIKTFLVDDRTGIYIPENCITYFFKDIIIMSVDEQKKILGKTINDCEGE